MFELYKKLKIQNLNSNNLNHFDCFDNLSNW